MIKNIFVALLAMLVVMPASAKDKKKKKVEEVQPVLINATPAKVETRSDSISYAAGQAYTMGLMEYLTGQLKVDTAYIKTFVAALHESVTQPVTPEMRAKDAGKQIAQMITDRMMPSLKEQMEGTDVKFDSLTFLRGFEDAILRDASILSPEEASKYLNSEMQKMKEMKDSLAKAEGLAWLAENAKKEGVNVLPSGLQYKVLVAGNGPVATADNEVVVKYEGKLLNGEVFDSSYKRTPDTTSFKPSQVIKGWTEALCLMPQGSTWELYIPYNLAYGERGTGKIPGFATLIFKVEVVEVK